MKEDYCLKFNRNSSSDFKKNIEACLNGYSLFRRKAGKKIDTIISDSLMLLLICLTLLGFFYYFQIIQINFLYLFITCFCFTLVWFLISILPVINTISIYNTKIRLSIIHSLLPDGIFYDKTINLTSKFFNKLHIFSKSITHLISHDSLKGRLYENNFEFIYNISLQKFEYKEGALRVYSHVFKGNILIIQKTIPPQSCKNITIQKQYWGTDIQVFDMEDMIILLFPGGKSPFSKRKLWTKDLSPFISKIQKEVSGELIMLKEIILKCRV